MVKEQWVTLAVVAVGALAITIAAAQPTAPTKDDNDRNKLKPLNAEIAAGKAVLDERGGYQRQLRQNAVTCAYKGSFQTIVALSASSLTPDALKTLECRVWDWPQEFMTDPSQEDGRFVRVKLWYPPDTWHWALQSSIVEKAW